MKFSYLTTIYFFQNISLLLAFLISIMAILRMTKIKQIHKIKQNQHFFNLIYCIFIYQLHTTNIFIFLPFVIHFYISICEYLYLQKESLYLRFKQHVDKAVANKTKVIYAKQMCQFYLICVYLFRLYMHKKPFQLLGYCFILVIKFVLNPLFRQNIKHQVNFN